MVVPGSTGTRRPHRMYVKSDHREEKLLDEAIDEVSLDEQMRSYFKRRYLEYLRWLEDGSATNLVLYYALRIPAIVLAALVPMLVALSSGNTNHRRDFRTLNLRFKLFQPG
jgi:hypothetical protein